MVEQVRAEGHSSWAQFSLRALMIAVTIFSVLLALAMVPPLLAIVFAVFYVALAGILVIAVWQGRGWIRAFSIGAVIPYVTGFFFVVAGRRSSELIVMAVMILVVTAIAGIAAAAFHGALARRGGVLPVPNLPLLRSWFTNDGPA